MNKRQKKKKGLLLIEKIYSNWGNKKNKSTEKKEVKKVKVEETPVEEVVEEVKEEKEEKEVKDEDKWYFLNASQKTTNHIITYCC